MRIAVGIAGGSGAGKTTLARKVAACLGEGAVIIEQDWYYRDQRDIPFERRVTVNYDHPGALETKLLVKQLRALLEGKAVEAPVYDFEQHTRRAETRHVEPAEVVLVEGLYVLHDAALRALLAVKVFVSTTPGTCLARRIVRDMLERGRTAESVTHQFETTVFPMYRRYVEPSSADADMVVHGDWNITRDMETLMSAIARAREGK